MNTIASTRLKVGLTKPQMLRLLGVKLGRTSLFTADDEDIDAIFIQQAREINDSYDRWVAHVLSDLMLAQQEYGELLTSTQAARVLDISEYHLVSLRRRGQVKGTQVVVNRWAYHVSALRKLVEDNSHTLSPDVHKARGPLANAFLRWHKRRERERQHSLAKSA